jgi:hypothetical protein
MYGHTHGNADTDCYPDAASNSDKLAKKRTPVGALSQGYWTT